MDEHNSFPRPDAPQDHHEPAPADNTESMAEPPKTHTFEPLAKTNAAPEPTSEPKPHAAFVDTSVSDSKPFHDTPKTPESPKPTAQKSTEPRSVRQKTSALRYVLMWISGLIFIPCLITVINIIIQTICDPSYIISSYAGQFYVAEMTALLIFGGTHLALSFSCVKDFKDKPIPKYVHVMGIIYAVGFAIAALAFLWLLVSGLFGSALGTTTLEGSEILTQTLVTIFSVAILLFSALEQLHLVRRIPAQIFPTTLGAVTLIAIVIFLCVPAGHARDAAYDERIEDDLSDINYAIRNYIDDNNKFPASLSVLKLSGLNNSIDSYTFKATSSSSRYNATYELCATFKTDTLSDDSSSYSSSYSSYSFSSHSKGNYCFTKEYTNYNYDYYYNTEDLEGDDTDSNTNTSSSTKTNTSTAV